jgi:hypothetical protein
VPENEKSTNERSVIGVSVFRKMEDFFFPSSLLLLLFHPQHEFDSFFSVAMFPRLFHPFEFFHFPKSENGDDDDDDVVWVV